MFIFTIYAAPKNNYLGVQGSKSHTNIQVSIMQYAISSITVLPTQMAPPLNTARTAGAVDVAAEWVLAQSG
uniref:Uncharacterized protein n=1 Tax=Rhizophora mucronata TaxID=61149 RepID=A0A2P2MRP3_RHIMU